MKNHKYKKILKKLLTLDGPPNSLAIAFAIGVFISFTPFYGLHSAMAAAAAYSLRLNIVALLAGAWLNNPLTTPFMYGISYFLGRLIIGGADLPAEATWKDLLTTHLGGIFFQLIIGCTAFVLLFGFISFWVMKYGIITYRKRRSSLPHESV
jgi:uncharacterized protein